MNVTVQSRTVFSFIFLVTFVAFVAGCGTPQPGHGSKRFPERLSDWNIIEEEGLYYVEPRQWEGFRYSIFEGDDPELVGIRQAPTRKDIFMLFYSPEPRSRAQEIRAMAINFRTRERIIDETHQYINEASVIPQPRWTWGGSRLIIEHPGMKEPSIISY